MAAIARQLTLRQDSSFFDKILMHILRSFLGEHFQQLMAEERPSITAQDHSSNSTVAATPFT